MHGPLNVKFNREHFVGPLDWVHWSKMHAMAKFKMFAFIFSVNIVSMVAIFTFVIIFTEITIDFTTTCLPMLCNCCGSFGCKRKRSVSLYGQFNFSARSSQRTHPIDCHMRGCHNIHEIFQWLFKRMFLDAKSNQAFNSSECCYLVLLCCINMPDDHLLLLPQGLGLPYWKHSR